MKVTQTWKRNMPSTLCGESIALTTVYSNFNKQEIDKLGCESIKFTTVCSSFDKQKIDKLEEKIPKGMIIMDDNKEKRGLEQ